MIYATAIDALEREGLTTSDAQAILDAEILQTGDVYFSPLYRAYLATANVNHWPCVSNERFDSEAKARHALAIGSLTWQQVIVGIEA